MLSGVKNSSNKLVGLWCGGLLCAKKSRATFYPQSAPGWNNMKKDIWNIYCTDLIYDISHE